MLPALYVVPVTTMLPLGSTVMVRPKALLLGGAIRSICTMVLVCPVALTGAVINTATSSILNPVVKRDVILEIRLPNILFLP